MQQQLIVLFIRWVANSAGLWVAFQIGLLSYGNKLINLLISALILAILNAIIKPLIIVFTLPAIALTLGFFLIIINGVVIWLLDIIYRPLEVSSFWSAILAGIVIGLINYIVTIVMEAIRKRNEHHL